MILFFLEIFLKINTSKTREDGTLIKNRYSNFKSYLFSKKGFILDFFNFFNLYIPIIFFDVFPYIYLWVISTTLDITLIYKSSEFQERYKDLELFLT